MKASAIGPSIEVKTSSSSKPLGTLAAAEADSGFDTSSNESPTSEDMATASNTRLIPTYPSLELPDCVETLACSYTGVLVILDDLACYKCPGLQDASRIPEK